MNLRIGLLFYIVLCPYSHVFCQVETSEDYRDVFLFFQEKKKQTKTYSSRRQLYIQTEKRFKKIIRNCFYNKQDYRQTIEIINFAYSKKLLHYNFEMKKIYRLSRLKIKHKSKD